MYSIIVLIAVFTSLMAAPLVRYCAVRSGSLQEQGNAGSSSTTDHDVLPSAE
jgi:hypothetical protein